MPRTRTPDTTPKPRRRTTKASLVESIINHRNRAKQHYEAADELFTKLLTLCKAGDTIPLPDGGTAQLVDNFAEKNKVFRSHGISRFELKIHEAKPPLPQSNGEA